MIKQKLVFLLLFFYIFNQNIFSQVQKGYESGENSSEENLSDKEKEIKRRAEFLKEKDQKKKQNSERRKNRGEYEKKAEDQINKEEKQQANQQKELAEARANARISGCVASSVYVNPNGQKYSRYRESIVLRIVNYTPGNIYIESSRNRDGLIIGNLCPGGSVTVSFVLGYFTNTYQGENFELVAIQNGNRNPNIFSVYLNNQGNHYSRIWTIY